MTRSVLIPPGGGLLVSPAVAAAIAPTLMRALSDARRLGIYPDPAVTETIERLATLGAGWTAHHDEVGVAPVDEVRCDRFPWVTVQQAASKLGVSEQAIRARLVRGSLQGLKVGRTWRVDARALAARPRS